MATSMLVLTADATCISRLPGAGGGGSTVVIKAAVGDANPPRCRNFPDDVREIQRALNRFTPLEGGPQPPLVDDGICGPLTRKAISHFQRKWELRPRNSTVPDGIVDPEGPTIQRLRKGPGGITSLPAEFMARLPRVTGIILRVRRSLDLARDFLGRGPDAPDPSSGFGVSGEPAARVVERHFHVKRSRDPLARIGEIDAIFLSMLTAVGFVPQGFILAADEPPSVAEIATMFTFPGGFHLRRQEDTFEGIPMGSIYLCPSARTLQEDAFTYAMIHELAHFAGPTVNGITDHAYFHKNPHRYRSLSDELAFRNADSYSQLAFETIGKPDFDMGKESS